MKMFYIKKMAYCESTECADAHYREDIVEKLFLKRSDAEEYLAKKGIELNIDVYIGLLVPAKQGRNYEILEHDGGWMKNDKDFYWAVIHKTVDFDTLPDPIYGEELQCLWRPDYYCLATDYLKARGASGEVRLMLVKPRRTR